MLTSIVLAVLHDDTNSVLMSPLRLGFDSYFEYDFTSF